jgi:glycosyltransferase involved in cell wall biosynthesis
MTSPLVSVVTPVLNGELHLRECIESVLAQTYPHWDYTIVDNCSSDRTPDIAQEYAARDRRIRVHRNESLVRVIANHNIAFRQISPDSKYCKVVAADDWLAPDCLEKMVRLAEAHPCVAIVGAYGLRGMTVEWTGLPPSRSVVAGREPCRTRLLGGRDVFGAPTSLLYRSDIVRHRPAFYNESNFHGDSEACLEFLEHQDFGFVHQILTFRSEEREGSMSWLARTMGINRAATLAELVIYGPRYLTAAEIERRTRILLRDYYRYLGVQVFRRHDREFWRLHEEKLAAIGHPLSRPRVAGAVLAYISRLVLHPGRTAGALARRVRARS